MKFLTVLTRREIAWFDAGMDRTSQRIWAFPRSENISTPWDQAFRVNAL